MELTIGVSVGSSIQIAAGMIPLLVIIAWPMNKDLTLFFANFETIVLFVSVMLVNLLLQDGESHQPCKADPRPHKLHGGSNA
jgi:Ca2+:H+ antiporter